MKREIFFPGAMCIKSESPLFPTFLPNNQNNKLCTSESRNPRRPPEETGPFGKRRNARYDRARSRTRTGTPAKKENPNVAEFGRLFAQQQEEEKTSSSLPKSSSSSTLELSRKPSEKIATECILYGYRNKDSEWKAIDKYERISQGLICEDYPRSDPNLTNKYPQMLSGGDVVIRANLSADANRKSKRYAGGFHWIKVTFDSTTAADRACFFSPQEIDGHAVYCEPYHGQGPAEDIAIPQGSAEGNRRRPKSHHTSSHSASFLHPQEPDRSAISRSFTANSLTTSGGWSDEGGSQVSSETASSATVTGTEQTPALRQRQASEAKPQSEFMTHIPTVRRVVLRPITEALPPQPTVVERILRSIPILRWFTGDIVGDGPQVREDGSFDYEKSTLYWRFWYMIDKLFGTDICGTKDES
jgi:hypothetical protein